MTSLIKELENALVATLRDAKPNSSQGKVMMNWSKVHQDVSISQALVGTQWLLNSLRQARLFKLPEDGLLFESFVDANYEVSSNQNNQQVLLPFEFNFFEWDQVTEGSLNRGEHYATQVGAFVWQAPLADIQKKLMEINEGFPLYQWFVDVCCSGFFDTTDQGCLILPVSRLSKLNKVHVTTPCVYVLNIDSPSYENYTFDYAFEDLAPADKNVGSLCTLL